MKYRRIITGTFFVLLAISAVFFLPMPIERKSEKILVSTSFYPLYYFAHEIGGGYAEVKNITPAGTEPHDYEPTAKDLAEIQSSDILILNGGGFEPWAASGLTEKVLLINATEGLINQNGDPHLWLSPLGSLQMAEKIFQAYSQIDPNHQSYYKLNFEGLSAKLKALDEIFRAELSVCQTRKFVTSHEAFGYLSKAYDLNQIAISGISPEEEPSPKDLGQIADFARANKIEYIFFESLVSPKLANTVANEIGAKTLVLNPIEGLTDEEIGNGNNYFSAMLENLENLKTAMKCTKK